MKVACTVMHVCNPRWRQAEGSEAQGRFMVTQFQKYIIIIYNEYADYSQHQWFKNKEVC